MRYFIRAIFLLALCCGLSSSAMASLVSPGDVIQGHAKEQENCDKCHKKFDKGAQAGLCRACHKDINNDINAKRGFHGRMKEQRDCKECHTEHKGRTVKIVIFDPTKFDHGTQTDFQLRGGHLAPKVKCLSCHFAGKKYSEAPSTCNGCHKKDDKHKGGLGTDCAKCHVEKDWKTTNFDHNKTNFKLLEKHIVVKCDKCHINGKYKDTPKACVACHKKDDEKAHRGKLGPKCESCHTEKDWNTTKFDHNKTNFRLLGKHDEVKCDKCHINKKYKGTPKLCYACHKKDDDTNVRAHKGKFGQKCETCHIERDWKEILFNHDKTKFPLIGKHRTPLKCVSCHRGDLYLDKLQTTCVSCHKKDDDKIHKGKYGAKCESCHTARDWKEITFDHARDTKYPLLGKHKSAKCVSCHQGDLFKDKLQTTCVSCHKKDDLRIHKGNFGVKCESCHVERDWKEILFDHNKQTKYPLTGKHKVAKCASCHTGDIYRDKLQTTCVSCHKKDDEKIHKGNFGIKCETCHVDRGWKEVLFNHDRDTKYALVGKHKLVKCASCHKGNIYTEKLQTTCNSCHEKDDKHKGQEGKKCETCHNVNDWKKTTFNHNTMSQFPLKASHGLVTCKKCHAAPTFKDAKSDCWSCHEKDDAKIHKRRLGTACETCHNERSWAVWDFDHDRTGFKLTGPHKNLSNCYACHIKPMERKVRAPTACGGCHDKDDIHNGEYGPQCDRCHIGDKWREVRVGSSR